MTKKTTKKTATKKAQTEKIAEKEPVVKQEPLKQEPRDEEFFAREVFEMVSSVLGAQEQEINKETIKLLMENKSLKKKYSKKERKFACKVLKAYSRALRENVFKLQ